MSIVTIRTGYRGTINAASNTVYRGEPGATVTAAIGVSLNTGDHDIEFAGIRFIGQGEAGDGVWALTRGVKRIRFTDCSFENFRAGATFHHPNLDNYSSPPAASEWSQDITFTRCRFTGMAGRGDKSGHGLFVANVDGLTVEACVIDGAGMANLTRKKWVHGAYVQSGCRRVAFRDCIVHNSESVGLQLRGPLTSTEDADSGTDPGPLVENVLLANNPVGVMPNGPRATVKDVLILIGPHHDSPDDTGEGGVYASVGELRMGNVLIARGTVDDTGYDMMPVRNAPRPQKDAINGRLKRWEWNRPCKTIETGPVEVKLDRRIDVADLVKQALDGAPVKPLIAEAWRRAKGEPQTPTPTPVPDVVAVPAPEGLRLVTNDGDRLEWEWRGVLGSTGYRIYLTDPSGSVRRKVEESGNAHHFTEALPGTYTVTALRGAVESPHSAGVAWAPAPDPADEAKAKRIAELKALILLNTEQRATLNDALAALHKQLAGKQREAEEAAAELAMLEAAGR